jgi:hypothetical protein
VVSFEKRHDGDLQILQLQENGEVKTQETETLRPEDAVLSSIYLR